MHSGHRGLPCFAWPLLPKLPWWRGRGCKATFAQLVQPQKQAEANRLQDQPAARPQLPLASPPASSPSGSHNPPQPLPHCPPGRVPALPPPHSLPPHPPEPHGRSQPTSKFLTAPSLSRKGKDKKKERDHDITGRFIWVCLFACWLD